MDNLIFLLAILLIMTLKACKKNANFKKNFLLFN